MRSMFNICERILMWGISQVNLNAMAIKRDHIVGGGGGVKFPRDIKKENMTKKGST